MSLPLLGYAVDPTASSASTEYAPHTHTQTHTEVCHNVSPCVCRLIGESDKADLLEGVTVFEAKTVATGVKRKRNDKGDPGDVDGYAGPWRGYVDQVTVSKPTEKQLALLEVQFGEKKKKKEVKEKEDTIDESTMLHGKCC